MSLWLAAYDMADDRARERVARVLGRHGQRVQASVFVIAVEPESLGELRLAVGAHLVEGDRFDLYPIDERGSRTHWRWREAIDEYEAVIEYE
jgi:CRISPR-associated endonuclease Cas2